MASSTITLSSRAAAMPTGYFLEKTVRVYNIPGKPSGLIWADVGSGCGILVKRFATSLSSNGFFVR